MDSGTSLGIAGLVVGVVGLGIAGYQTWHAKVSKREAADEKKRAATLERYLSAQRWQQLRSTAEQIDAIEKDGRHSFSAKDAATHATLKQQYSATMSVLATSTGSLSAATVRHWIELGRLPRPWHIAEAVQYIEAAQIPEGVANKDLAWVLEHAHANGAVSRPAALRAPSDLTDEVAAYIILARINVEHIRRIVPALIHDNRLTVLLNCMAHDCVRISRDAMTQSFKCWGTPENKTFLERFDYYTKQDFTLIQGYAAAIRMQLSQFDRFFSDGYMLVATDAAVEEAHAKFANLLVASRRFPA